MSNKTIREAFGPVHEGNSTIDKETLPEAKTPEFEVKYSSRKSGPIKVTKFMSQGEAQAFLKKIRGEGMQGIVSKGGKPVRTPMKEDAKAERLAKIARAAKAGAENKAKEKAKATEKHNQNSAKSREATKYLGNKDQFGRVRENTSDDDDDATFAKKRRTHVRNSARKTKAAMNDYGTNPSRKNAKRADAVNLGHDMVKRTWKDSAAKRRAAAKNEEFEITEAKSTYKLKKTKTEKETDAGDYENETQLIVHFDVMQGGKKVGEIKVDDYFGTMSGNLHGKKLPKLDGHPNTAQKDFDKFLKSKSFQKSFNEEFEITESDKAEYDKLMKQYGDMPASKIPPKTYMRISQLGRKVRGDKGGPKVGDLLKSMKQKKMGEAVDQVDEATRKPSKIKKGTTFFDKKVPETKPKPSILKRKYSEETNEATNKFPKWWEDTPKNVLTKVYHAKRQIPPKLDKKSWQKIVNALHDRRPAPLADYRKWSTMDPAKIQYNKESVGKVIGEESIKVNGGSAVEIGKNERGSKTQYYWKDKSGLKNVFDTPQKLRYSLRNDANFSGAEKAVKQLLGEAKTGSPAWWRAEKERESKLDIRTRVTNRVATAAKDGQKIETSIQARKRRARAEKANEEFDQVDEAKMGDIRRNIKKGDSPYTVVAIVNNKVVDQDHAKIPDQVPALVRELKKEYPNAKISVEDRGGRVVHAEAFEIDERLTGEKKASREKSRSFPGRSGDKESRDDSRWQERTGLRPDKDSSKSQKRAFSRRSGSGDKRQGGKIVKPDSAYSDRVESDISEEVDGWVAMYNGKRLEIPNDGTVKGIAGAKAKAIKDMKVPKSKIGMLAIKPSINEVRIGIGSRSFRGSGMRTPVRKRDDEGYRKDGSNPVDDAIMKRNAARRKAIVRKVQDDDNKNKDPKKKNEEVDEVDEGGLGNSKAKKQLKSFKEY